MSNETSPLTSSVELSVYGSMNNNNGYVVESETADSNNCCTKKCGLKVAVVSALLLIGGGLAYVFSTDSCKTIFCKVDEGCACLAGKVYQAYQNGTFPCFPCPSTTPVHPG